MRRHRIVHAVVGAVALTSVAFVPAVQATGTGEAATCSQRLGWITADGAQGGWGLETPDVFAPGSARLSTRFVCTLFRWNLTGTLWSRAGSAPGFAAVKSMALISKTRYYDTFLANTRGGALYTIRIPVASSMKPIVTPVRTRTWQGFEQLVASKCGQYGTILLGIDKDTKTAYQYAVGHANGTSTVIQSLGKAQGTYDDPVYYRWAAPWPDPLNGD